MAPRRLAVRTTTGELWWVCICNAPGQASLLALDLGLALQRRPEGTGLVSDPNRHLKETVLSSSESIIWFEHVSIKHWMNRWWLMIPAYHNICHHRKYRIVQYRYVSKRHRRDFDKVSPEDHIIGTGCVGSPIPKWSIQAITAQSSSASKDAANPTAMLPLMLEIADC